MGFKMYLQNRPKLLLILTLSILLGSCAGRRHLERIVQEGPDLIVALNKGKISASPAFPAPYDHPLEASPPLLQHILESVRVSPRKGILNTLFSSKEKDRLLFNMETIRLLSVHLSSALAKATPSERAVFYQAIPNSAAKVFVTSGFLLVKDRQLHLRVDHYRVPHRKGSPLHRVGNDLPPSEKVKYNFTLSENAQMKHRRFKNALGLPGSDPHWLVMSYEDDFTVPSSPSPLSAPPAIRDEAENAAEDLEGKLRMLKRFRDEGLITEDEYIEKKGALLKDF